jgi:hypothetical protein
MYKKKGRTQGSKCSESEHTGADRKQGRGPPGPKCAPFPNATRQERMRRTRGAKIVAFFEEML